MTFEITPLYALPVAASVPVAAAAAPARIGFGTELITKRVPYELRGRGSVDFEPGGARCMISFPLLPGESIFQSDSPMAFRDTSLFDEVTA